MRATAGERAQRLVEDMHTSKERVPRATIPEQASDKARYNALAARPKRGSIAGPPGDLQPWPKVSAHRPAGPPARASDPATINPLAIQQGSASKARPPLKVAAKSSCRQVGTRRGGNVPDDLKSEYSSYTYTEETDDDAAAVLAPRVATTGEAPPLSGAVAAQKSQAAAKTEPAVQAPPVDGAPPGEWSDDDLESGYSEGSEEETQQAQQTQRK